MRGWPPNWSKRPIASRRRSFLEKDGVEVNGRSILGILTLYCPQGSRLTIRVEGVDAEEAIAAFARLIEEKVRRDVTAGCSKTLSALRE